MKIRTFQYKHFHLHLLSEARNEVSCSTSNAFLVFRTSTYVECLFQPDDEMHCQDEFREVCTPQKPFCRHEKGNSADSKCHSELRKRCRTIPNPECLSGTRKTCSKIPREECNSVPVQVERAIKIKRCSMLPTIKCSTSPRIMCTNKCRHEGDHPPSGFLLRNGKELGSCFMVPEQECHFEPAFDLKCPKEKCRPSSIQVCRMRQPGCLLEECRIKQVKSRHCSGKRCKRDKGALHKSNCSSKPTRKCMPCVQRRTCIPVLEQRCHRELKPFCATKKRMGCQPKCQSVFVCPVCKNQTPLKARQPKKFHPSLPHDPVVHTVDYKETKSLGSQKPPLRPDIALTLQKLKQHRDEIPSYHKKPQESDLPAYSKGGW
jgi:hypothetical protein